MTITINRVTTKVGDKGTTRLAGGQEVDKDDPRIEAYGTLDELNAVLGMLVEAMRRDGIDESFTRRVRRIQNEIFDLGGELAVLPEDRHPSQSLIGRSDIERLESEIEEVNSELPTLRSFILPGGSETVASFHWARTVTRRAERRLVTLLHAASERPETQIYLNRLGDWLFVFGRKAAKDRGIEEILWQPGTRR